MHAHADREHLLQQRLAHACAPLDALLSMPARAVQQPRQASCKHDVAPRGCTQPSIHQPKIQQQISARSASIPCMHKRADLRQVRQDVEGRCQLCEGACIATLIGMRTAQRAAVRPPHLHRTCRTQHHSTATRGGGLSILTFGVLGSSTSCPAGAAEWLAVTHGHVQGSLPLAVTSAHACMQLPSAFLPPGPASRATHRRQSHQGAILFAIGVIVRRCTICQRPRCVLTSVCVAVGETPNTSYKERAPMAPTDGIILPVTD